MAVFDGPVELLCNALALCTNPQGFYSRTVAEVGDNGSATCPLKPRQPPSLALGRSSPGGFCTHEFVGRRANPGQQEPGGPAGGEDHTGLCLPRAAVRACRILLTRYRNCQPDHRIAPLQASENSRRRTTSLLVASRQSGHLNCAQRPAILLSLTRPSLLSRYNGGMRAAKWWADNLFP